MALREGGCGVRPGLPYAWVNLKNGVVEEARSVLETNTAAVGSFTIEMTVLSRLTGADL